MSKDHESFTPALPSVEVQRFLRENPISNWEESLEYVTNLYPQIENGVVQWIIEGGTAVKLHNPNRRTPNDIDIITTLPEMKDEFTNSRRFDVKTLQDWFSLRGLEYTDERGELLFSSLEFINFQEKPLLVLNPIALAVSKTISTHRYSPQRPEDKDDIDLLLVDDLSVSRFIKTITESR